MTDLQEYRELEIFQIYLLNFVKGNLQPNNYGSVSLNEGIVVSGFGNEQLIQNTVI